MRQEAKALQNQMNIEIQYKAKFAQLYNTERKKNNGQSSHLLVSQSSSKYDIPRSVNQLPSLHLQQSRCSSQASPRDLNDSTLRKIIALDNEVDGFKRECQLSSTELSQSFKKPKGQLGALFKEYERGMNDWEQDWRVNELTKSLEERNAELHTTKAQVRGLETELMRSKELTNQKDRQMAEMSQITDELASSNQTLQQKVQYLQKANDELRSLKLIGVNHADAEEMIRQVAVFRQNQGEAVKIS